MNALTQATPRYSLLCLIVEKSPLLVDKPRLFRPDSLLCRVSITSYLVLCHGMGMEDSHSHGRYNILQMFEDRLIF